MTLDPIPDSHPRPMPPDPNNPFARTTAFQRLRHTVLSPVAGTGRAVGRLIRRLWTTVRHAPLVVRILLVVAVLGGAGGSGYYLLHRRAKIATQRAVSAGWQEFETEARTGGGDADDLLAALEKVLAANPTDPTAVRRKAALERGGADPDDQAMVILLLRAHLAKGRWEAAAAEATKRLADSPNDYLAHAALAAHNLNRQDRAAAEPHLAALADPDASGANPDPGGLRFALVLYQSLGRDAKPIRQFTLARLLPKFRGDAVLRVPPAGQAMLVTLYADLFAEGAGEGTVLSGSWGPVSRLAAVATDAALTAKDAKTLANIGEAGHRLAGGLAMLHAAKLVTDEEKAALSAELEERTRKAWQGVLAADPASGIAYHGLTLSYLRSGDSPKAIESANAGLTAAKDDLTFYRLVATLFRSAGQDEVAMRRVREAAERNPEVVGWWLLLADACLGGNRRDLAIGALKKAQAAAPQSAVPIYLEARLQLDAGRPEEAVKRLKALNEDAMAKDADAARAYTRALVETNDLGTAEVFFNKTDATANATNSPAVPAAALRGRFDAPADTGRAKTVLAAAMTLQRRWPDDAALALLKAEAMVRLIELGPPAWPEPACREAAAACEVGAALNPGNLRPAAGRAWVLVRGLNQPADALKAAAPLVKAAATGTLSVEFSEILSEVLLANGKTDEAFKVLDRARTGREVTAGCLVQLARAYLARGQVDEARQTLRLAAGRPQSARERADYDRTAAAAFK